MKKVAGNSTIKGSQTVKSRKPNVGTAVSYRVRHYDTFKHPLPEDPLELAQFRADPSFIPHQEKLACHRGYYHDAETPFFHGDIAAKPGAVMRACLRPLPPNLFMEFAALAKDGPAYDAPAILRFVSDHGFLGVEQKDVGHPWEPIRESVLAVWNAAREMADGLAWLRSLEWPVNVGWLSGQPFIGSTPDMPPALDARAPRGRKYMGLPASEYGRRLKLTAEFQRTYDFQRMVAQHLENAFSVELSGLVPHLVAHNLLTFMWWQLGNALVSGAGFDQCPECGEWIVVRAAGKQRPNYRRTCGDLCRVKQYHRAIRQAVTLAAEGMSVESIVAKLQGPPLHWHFAPGRDRNKTVRGWLDKANAATK